MPRALTTAHRAAIERLPIKAPEPLACVLCGLDRVRVVLEPSDAWPVAEYQRALPVTPRWACPRCQVVLATALELGELWAAVLRSAVDPYWAWVPEEHRAAFARAGFGLVAGGDRPDHQLGIVGDEVWASEGSWALINTGAVPSRLAVLEEGLGWSPSARLEQRIPTRYLLNILLTAGHAPVIEGPPPAEPGSMETCVVVGTALLQRRFVTLVQSVWPCALEWRGRGPLDPVSVFHDDKALAVFMPINPEAS